MRVTSLSLLALPFLAVAQNANPLEQAKIQAQQWGSWLQKFIQHPHPNPGPSVASKAGGRVVHRFSLYDWEETMRSTIKADAATTGSVENWWVYITGGNKTCFGHCGKVDKAFNETALLWALDPKAPHLGYINCDEQPVLCNSWGAGSPSLWIFELRPKPFPTNTWLSGFNITTANVTTFTHLREKQPYKNRAQYEGYFQPFDGVLAQFHLAKPVGYIFWAFTILPNWLFMILISFLSRSFMGNRMNPTGPPPRAGAAPAAPAPRAAPAGGVRR